MSHQNIHRAMLFAGVFLATMACVWLISNRRPGLSFQSGFGDVRITELPGGGVDVELGRSLAPIGEANLSGLQSMRVVSLCVYESDLHAGSGKGLSQLHSLRKLAVLNCNISRDAFVGVSKMPSLSSMSITGSPEVTDDQVAVFLGGCHNLRELSLYSTGVGDKGAYWLKSLPGLTSLSLSNTRCSRDVFTRLAGAVLLKKLWLDGTVFDRESYNSLSKATSLELLDLSRTPIDDGIGDCLAEFSHLTELILSHTSISDAAIRPASRAKVSVLDLEGTNVTGSALSHPALSELTVLHVSHCKKLRDSTLLALSGFRKLVRLGISETDIGDAAFLKLVHGAASLEEVDASNCARIGDITMKALSNLPKIRNVSVRGTQVSEIGVRALFESGSVREVWVSGSRFDADIRNDIAKLAAERGIELRGIIPRE